MVLDLGQEVCTKISVMKYKLWLSIRATMVPYQCHGKINLTYSYMGLNHGTLLIFTIQIKNSILFELFSLGKNQIIWDWFFVSFQLKNNSNRMFFPIYWTFLGILMWIWHLYMFSLSQPKIRVLINKFSLLFVISKDNLWKSKPTSDSQRSRSLRGPFNKVKAIVAASSEYYNSYTKPYDEEVTLCW